MKRKIAILLVVSLLLAGYSGQVKASNKKEETMKERNEYGEMSLQDELESFSKYFNEYSCYYNEETNKVYLHMETPFGKDEYELFDGEEKLSWTEGLLLKYGLCNFVCDASFDMESLVFTHSVSILTSSGKKICSFEKTTPAKVTEYGGLEAQVDLGSEAVMISDLDYNSLFGSVVPNSDNNYEKSYYILTTAAEETQSQTNYEYNRNLEKNGNGVDRGNYIYGQSDVTTPGRKSGNYRFGFGKAKFSKVGCEIAACYNIAIALGSPEWLSSTVRYCEQNMKIDVGLGHLGSNPHEISKYLNYKGFHYLKRNKFSELKTEVNNRSRCRIIMSRWNDPITDGLHTFYVNKLADSNFRSYNKAVNSTSLGTRKSTLDTYNDGGGFITGYIVWK